MKKNYFNLMMCAAIFAAAVLASCSKDDNTEPKPQESNELAGAITKTKSLDASIEYKLTGPLIVENGGVLNIPAGTVIKSAKGFSNYILVLQGGKIFAKGTADKPIKMTADAPNAEPGHWGGLVINGKAKISGDWTGGKTPTGTTEISSSHIYGGTDNDDSSGEITYLILEYTGAKSSADIEHNGLTLNAVGRGTKIENIFVPNGADDGVEFFGGSVNVKNLLVVNSDDDMFDFTQGYTGTLENCYGIWEAGYSSEESDPRGVEADGNLDGKNPEHTNQSDFSIKNMTIDLRLAASENSKSQMLDVLKIRRSAKATVTNALVKGTGTAVDLINLTGTDANTATAISLTSTLMNIKGKEINASEGVSYPNVKVEAGNTGCPTSIFSWTGYKF